MTYRLTATIAVSKYDDPIVHHFLYTGPSLASIVDQIDTLPFHRFNLRTFGRTAFKDARGIKHRWKLVKVNDTES